MIVIFITWVTKWPQTSMQHRCSWVHYAHLTSDHWRMCDSNNTCVVVGLASWKGQPLGCTDCLRGCMRLQQRPTVDFHHRDVWQKSRLCLLTASCSTAGGSSFFSAKAFTYIHKVIPMRLSCSFSFCSVFTWTSHMWKSEDERPHVEH